MGNGDLKKYIADLKAKNVSDEQIKKRLLDSGWSEKDLLSAFVDDSSDTELPPPPVPHFGMWVTFEYIILFLTMYASFIALGRILHFIVDRYFSIEAMSSVGLGITDSSSILLTLYMAAIIVTFPIFAIVFIHTNHLAKLNPGIRNIRSRKIFIYITLLIIFIYLTFLLISNLYNFFRGESTIATVLHLFVNLLVAGSVFFYLIYDIWGDRKGNA